LGSDFRNERPGWRLARLAEFQPEDPTEATLQTGQKTSQPNRVLVVWKRYLKRALARAQERLL
jgi:hypothetical protein